MTGFLLTVALWLACAAVIAGYIRHRRRSDTRTQPRLGTGPDTQPGPLDDTYRALEHLYHQPTARRRTT